MDKGTALSDEAMKTLATQLDEMYADAYKAAIENHQKALAKLANLTDEALADLSPEMRQLKRLAFQREVNRRGSIVQQIGTDFSKAHGEAARHIQATLTEIYGINYDFASFDLCRQSGLNLTADFATYDRRQLESLIQEGQSPFTKIAYKQMGKDAAIVKQLKTQMGVAIMNGESQQKLLKRIQSVTGQLRWQAKRVAQTERVRVQSEARFNSMQQGKALGLEMEKEWTARLYNTRIDHALAHLEVVGIDEKFSNGLMHPGDPNGSAAQVINCRCVMKPQVKSASSALAESREAYRKASIERFPQLTQRDIIAAENDLQHYTTQAAKNKEYLAKAKARNDTKAAEYWQGRANRADYKVQYSKTHLANAKRNDEIAREKTNGLSKGLKQQRTIAGKSQGNPMTFQEANQLKCNPNFKSSEAYRINCQSCVVSYEARRRGYDVQTLPNTKGSMLEKLSKKTNLAWIDPETGKHPEYIFDVSADSPRKLFQFLQKEISQSGRYTLEFNWKGRGNKGHIISTEKGEDGKFFLYDPQIGKKYTDVEALRYLTRLKYETSVYGSKFKTPAKLLKVDGLDFNEEIVDFILEGVP